ncbi:uncharacterized protein LOC130698706 [Daphnia carinata]|uniref:uncharacterized protein LOC130698706 n=1 Tax=Daphnia carinata TaxID=120202 RepID=UPI00257C91E8|nr:uncharacterized protein LOC130698706 [Daphnia carinata]
MAAIEKNTPHLMEKLAPTNLYPPAPWEFAKINLGRLKIDKKTATSAQHLARNQFLENLDNLQPGELVAYTDGSVDPKSGNASSAIYVPGIKLQKGWKLKKYSSILSAELNAINKALDICYDATESGVTIYTDSLSAILTIANANKNWRTHSVLLSINRSASNLAAAGIETTIFWIPSHTAIEGNEIADGVAKETLTNPRAETIQNKLTINEIYAIMKKGWNSELMCDMKLLKRWNPIWPKLGMKSWEIGRNTEETLILHRLRTGKTKLNYNLSKYDPLIDPLCPNGCPEIETVGHVILHCPTYCKERTDLILFCQRENINLTISNILGLTEEVETKHKAALRNIILNQIKKSDLTNRI